jgi:hypothetical protein
MKTPLRFVASRRLVVTQEPQRCAKAPGFAGAHHQPANDNGQGPRH